MTAGAAKRVARVKPTTTADLIGGGLLVAGASDIYRPAGFIVAGLLILAGSWSAAGKDAP